jgi:hypothetical protein
MKKSAILLLAAVLLLSVLGGCGKNPAAEDSADNAGKKYCSIEIRCDTILENMDKLPESKKELIPEDGLILYVEKAEFTEGESVFDVLKRELQSRKLHFEYVESKVYESAYIEGINNLYEFDCGELSGWVYSVNGEFASYGSALYTLQDMDAVKVLYTCDLGADVGNIVNEK